MRQRLSFIDDLRGLSLVSMVLFHLCYDLRYLAGMDLSFFGGLFEDVWRASISWVFLFVAGWMCLYSKSNLRRAGRYLLVALLIYIVTAIASVDEPISFGIIFCMGASTLLAWALLRLRILRGSWWLTAALFVAFLALLGLQSGTVGIGPWSITVSRALYSTPYLSWLGFPGPHFSSGDYYPLLPYCLLFLAGANFGVWLQGRRLPALCTQRLCRPLEFVGRHTLVVYLLHQPLLLLLLGQLG